jgi:hypothetical protein
MGRTLMGGDLSQVRREPTAGDGVNSQVSVKIQEARVTRDK